MDKHQRSQGFSRVVVEIPVEFDEFSAGGCVGTLFNLFVQPPIEGHRNETEVIEVSSPRGSISDGPSDDRMYVIEPVGKNYPYGTSLGPLGTPFIYLPPWHGMVLPPARPNGLGNFDHYHPSDSGFRASHVFGVVRFTLDVWERYLGQPLVWHFRNHFRRLQISILPQWNNAQYGYGYLEIGSHVEEGKRVASFALDFDVIAHEIGHAIVYSVLGVPSSGTEYPEYLGFHESFSDCVSLIAAMHFPSVLVSVLEQTSGNLSRENRLARFSEFAPQRQLRRANNRRTMAEFAHQYKDEHALSQPLTGAIFDILADIFHEKLVERGLISRDVENLADIAEYERAAEPLIQKAFDRAFAADALGFRESLEAARDIVGACLAEALWSLSVEFLDYGDVARAFASADLARTGGKFSGIIRRNFLLRSIGRVHAGRRAAGREHPGHSRSDRTLLPRDHKLLPTMSYRESYMLSRTMRSL